MRMLAAVAVTIVLGAAAPPAVGASEPLVTDIAGDANGVNTQGLPVPMDVGVGTSPASIDGADITAISMETLYDTVRERDENGALLVVRHVPHSLRISIQTTGPIKPAAGPTLVYRVPVTLDTGCTVFFQMYVKGSAPGASDVERADIQASGCGNAIIDPAFTLTIAGNVATMTYPFEKTQGLLIPWRALSPWTRPHVRPVLGTGTSTGPTAPAIDETRLIPLWAVAQDVPADVWCVETPEHPECQG